ncbi:hypothetical protein [Bacillus sp. Bos-x628]|uniref:hypothetical protein n=1 Tax=Bacillus maqinnsis TaxID=3229854 RepID=UPI00338F9CDA
MSLVVVPSMMNFVYGNDDLLIDVYAKGAYGGILLRRITIEVDMMIVTIIKAIMIIMLMPILGFLFGKMMIDPFALFGMAHGKIGVLGIISFHQDQGVKSIFSKVKKLNLYKILYCKLLYVSFV